MENSVRGPQAWAALLVAFGGCCAWMAAYPVMSAHHSTSHSKDSGSPFWSFVNIVLAFSVGGFALFWGLALFLGAVRESSKDPNAAKVAVVEEAAAAVPATTAAAAPAPAPAASNTAPVGTAPAVGGHPVPVAADSTKEPASPAAGAVLEVLIKPDITNPLAYDVKEFKVKAGQKVKLTFNNTHPAVPQPHNLVISKTGTKDKLMAVAMQMAMAPDGMAKGFIPDSPDILFHTKLLQPNTVEVMEFTAPAAGDYPYLCTFPGHGILMNGVMHVE